LLSAALGVAAGGAAFLFSRTTNRRRSETQPS
jgi:hypothetical protein